MINKSKKQIFCDILWSEHTKGFEPFRKGTGEQITTFSDLHYGEIFGLEDPLECGKTFMNKLAKPDDKVPNDKAALKGWCKVFE